MEIQVEIIGGENLLQGLQALGNWVDLRRVVDKLDDEFHAINEETFANNNWTPLDANYARRKARQFPSQPILRATDRMFSALTSEGSESIKRATETEVVLGATGIAGQRGVWHQLGAGRLPVREIVTERGSERYARVVTDDMVEFAKAQGFQVV